ncbi:hypothetical protein C4D60_Mb08t10940 [Musa balbisiana]|uniref:Transmembrane and coiled-coil domain-containing protein 4 n=1 Tax=Musa balbisiana TaxID=52838 RepID=A0A4S8K2V1_MUSBA|nr:hypothetical protein C4D60_Mb08t10940 [Musa balbisiana]
MAPSLLNPTHRYAAGALLALALRQAQIHQTRPLGYDDPDPDAQGRCSTGSATSSEGDGDDPGLWTHESCGLLRPVFRFLDIDPKAWSGLEETAASSMAKHHIGAYLRIIFEEDSESSSEKYEQELTLAEAVDAMAVSLEAACSSGGTSEEHHKYDQEYHDRAMTPKETHHNRDQEYHDRSTLGSCSESFDGISETSQTLEGRNSKVSFKVENGETTIIQDTPYYRQRRMVLLYELLSACVADTPQDNKKVSQFRKGYDARHRVALRLLATWLDVKWIKVEAMEIMVACSAMAAAKEEVQSQESESTKSKWSKWKRGGIIGAAALTGGALLAITGGLAAPAIAAGFSALAPTLGTLVPIVGASGFAAIASAAGSVAGSVAVAASFGAAGAGLTGSKMARRIGGIEEFDFKQIGENHNQGRLGVGIFVSGFVFQEEDFVRPWEGPKDNLERYVLQWESKNLISLSTAIQDWLTSRLAMGLMKQGAMMTVLSTLITALAWPATLIAATDFIDSKWSIAIDRPVTLIGFSLGARVIYKCLQALAVSGDNEGLVERVVLLGAPLSVKGEQWDIVRKIAAGRFINVYSTNDWILGVAFRASLFSQGLAGIQPIDIPGVENIDATDYIDGHSSYLWTSRRILEQLELDAYFPVFSHLPVNPDEQGIQTQGD